MELGDIKNSGKNLGLSGPSGNISAEVCLFPAKNQDFNFNFFDFLPFFGLFRVFFDFWFMKHFCGPIVRWETDKVVPKYQKVIEKFPEILLDNPMM